MTEAVQVPTNPTGPKQTSKANQIADKVSSWIFGVLFVLLMIGAADPFLNGVIGFLFVDKPGFFEQVAIELFGPADYADRLRREGFFGFIVLSVFLSLAVSLMGYAVTFLFAKIAEADEKVTLPGGEQEIEQ